MAMGRAVGVSSIITRHTPLHKLSLQSLHPSNTPLPPPQVQNLNLPGSDYFQKLTLLKREKGGLSAEDEKRFRDLRRRLEGEILEHADVVCTTCVGAGDPRLQNFRFQVKGKAGR